MARIEQSEIIQSMRNTLSMESLAISQLEETLDIQVADMLVGYLDSCKGKVITTGCGTSGTAARKIAHTLSCIKHPALFLSPSEALHGGLGVIGTDDIVILITKGGHTSELQAMFLQLCEMQVKTIVVAENPNCQMAQQCSLFVKIQVQCEPDSFNMLATSSTLAVIAYFDAIAIVMKENSGFSKEDFLQIHPGGEVGQRLQHDTKK